MRKSRTPRSWFHWITIARSRQLARQSAPRNSGPLASSVRLMQSREVKTGGSSARSSEFRHA